VLFNPALFFFLRFRAIYVFAESLKHFFLLLGGKPVFLQSFLPSIPMLCRASSKDFIVLFDIEPLICSYFFSAALYFLLMRH
jgi:hypothetical protein